MKTNNLTLPNPSDVVFVHYLCEDFDDGEGIFNLMLAKGNDSIVHRWDIKSKESEIKALEDYFAFLETNCKGLRTIHWNQGVSYFGLNHLNRRYYSLTGKNASFSYNNSFNLSDYLTQKYGDKYIAHPRLDNLAELNGFTGIREMDKNKRTFPDKRLLLLVKIFHAEYRGELKIVKQPVKKEVNMTDFIISHKQEITDYLKTELFQQKSKKVAVTIYALKELKLIDYTQRKKLYTALRNLLGEIGTDESLNKYLRFQMGQLDYQTQQEVRLQMKKIQNQILL